MVIPAGICNTIDGRWILISTAAEQAKTPFDPRLQIQHTLDPLPDGLRRVCALKAHKQTRVRGNDVQRIR